MDYSTSILFFDGHFWVMVCETFSDDQTLIARHVFGSEPSGPEILAFVRLTWVDYQIINPDQPRRPTQSYGFKKQLHKNRHQLNSGHNVSKARQQQNLLIASLKNVTAQNQHNQHEVDQQEKRRKFLDKRRQKKRGR